MDMDMDGKFHIHGKNGYLQGPLFLKDRVRVRVVGSDPWG